MGSKKSPKVVNPDPTPTTVTSDGPEARMAAEDERQRLKSQYGRAKTILAGDVSQQQDGKRTLLGGV